VLLQVSGVKLSFSNTIILDGVTFRIDRKEKVALVGRNGTGKTTLIKLIIGEELTPDEGSIHLAKGAKIGYLRQENKVSTGRTVLEEIEQVKEEHLELRRRLSVLEERLLDSPTDEELEEYATLQEHFVELEGYAAERDVRTVLGRMGFSEADYDKPVDKLSGGEKTRLALARLLLEEPDLLILDEPTNHLDLDATEWLEGWLKNYPGAVLTVSHDRTFLERLGEKFLHLENGVIETYPGPFNKYVQLRQENLERQAVVAKKQAEQIAKLDEYVRRFMNSQRTAQARGRLKLMEKLKSQQVERPTAERSMAATFKAQARSGDKVLEVKNLTKSFGERVLFKDVNFTVQRNQRIGVIGQNGAGKSTLIRILLGLIEPSSGMVKTGSNVIPAYFSQDAVELDHEMTPLDVLVHEFGLVPQVARDLLGRLLISGDDCFRKIKTLSGGEKNKVALAALTSLEPNLLILDEPTNHLDMDSRDALAGMLREYDGTLILISHDRWLLSEVTNHTIDIRRDGVVSYPGSYPEYVRHRSKPVSQFNSKGKGKAQEAQAAKPAVNHREIGKEIAKNQKRIEELEGLIATTEAIVLGLEHKLSSPPTGDALTRLLREYEDAKAQVSALTDEWVELSERNLELAALRG
jgi:ATP-binding cassette subfamily F protein 3